MIHKTFTPKPSLPSLSAFFHCNVTSHPHCHLQDTPPTSNMYYAYRTRQAVHLSNVPSHQLLTSVEEKLTSKQIFYLSLLSTHLLPRGGGGGWGLGEGGGGYCIIILFQHHPLKKTKNPPQQQCNSPEFFQAHPCSVTTLFRKLKSKHVMQKLNSQPCNSL